MNNRHGELMPSFEGFFHAERGFRMQKVIEYEFEQSVSIIGIADVHLGSPESRFEELVKYLDIDKDSN